MNTENNNQVDEVTEQAPGAEQSEPVVEPASPSPGALLCAQRETLELTIQQVADKLNLTMHYVRCLESDSYDKLPGDVFVRGYIRAYANLLQLDAPQVIAVYNEFTNKKLARKEEAIKRYTRRRRDKNRPWIIVSGVAFVGVALALWYFNAGTSTDEPLGNTAAPGIDSVPLFAETPSLPASSADSQAVDAGMETEMESSADDSVITDETMTGDEPAIDGANGSTLGAAPEQNSNLISLSWGGDDSVQLEFAEDSWVEVEHRGSNQAHRELRVSGETLLIQGTAPFSILLGNARAVTLTFNGRRVDISSNIRADNTARLSIGM